MDFKEVSNPWSVFILPDGRELRVRHILVDVMQVGTDPDGQPLYNLNFGPIVHIEPTDAQKAAMIEASRKAMSDQIADKGTTLQ